jgi:hypothetical protein
LLPGIRLNLGKRNVSFRFGGRGNAYTVGTAGKRISTGIPDSGLYYTEKLDPANPTPSRDYWKAYGVTTVANVIGGLLRLGMK